MANPSCEYVWTRALFDRHTMGILISCPLFCNVMFFLPLYQIWPQGHHSGSKLVSTDHCLKRAPTTLQLMQAVVMHGNATKFNRAPPILRTEALRMEKRQRNQANNKKMQGGNARIYIRMYEYQYYACLYVSVCVFSYIYTCTQMYTHRHTYVGLIFFHTQNIQFISAFQGRRRVDFISPLTVHRSGFRFGSLEYSFPSPGKFGPFLSASRFAT